MTETKIKLERIFKPHINARGDLASSAFIIDPDNIIKEGDIVEIQKLGHFVVIKYPANLILLTSLGYFEKAPPENQIPTTISKTQFSIQINQTPSKKTNVFQN